MKRLNNFCIDFYYFIFMLINSYIFCLSLTIYSLYLYLSQILSITWGFSSIMLFESRLFNIFAIFWSLSKHITGKLYSYFICFKLFSVSMLSSHEWMRIMLELLRIDFFIFSGQSWEISITCIGYISLSTFKAINGMALIMGCLFLDFSNSIGKISFKSVLLPVYGFALFILWKPIEVIVNPSFNIHKSSLFKLILSSGTFEISSNYLQYNGNGIISFKRFISYIFKFSSALYNI